MVHDIIYTVLLCVCMAPILFHLERYQRAQYCVVPFTAHKHTLSIPANANDKAHNHAPFELIFTLEIECFVYVLQFNAVSVILCAPFHPLSFNENAHAQIWQLTS